jgi:hypothetical protein
MGVIFRFKIQKFATFVSVILLLSVPASFRREWPKIIYYPWLIFRLKIQKFAVAPVDKDLIEKSLAPQKSISEMDISGSQDDYEEIKDIFSRSGQASIFSSRERKLF